MCFIKHELQLPVFTGWGFFAPQTSLRRSSVGVNSRFFLPRRSDDDPATERKVASLLETVNKIKWKPAEGLDGQEEKVRPGADVCARVALTDVLVRNKW